MRRLARQSHGRGDRVRIDVGPDWFPSATDALLLESRRVARELRTQIQMHLLETRYEMLMARRWLGRSAVEHLAEIGFLGPDLVAAHSVWLTERDMDLYADAGVVAVHNPASNLRLFSGIAPVREMLARQVAVAIGGDGLAFADDNDLLSDLRLAGHLQRTPGIMAEGLSARALLEMATITGARAVGMGGEVGELAPGRRADLVLMRKARMLSPYFHPAIAIEEALLARGRGDDVDVVMVGGRVVVNAGRTVLVDEAALAQALEADAVRAFADSSLPTDDGLARELEPYALRLLAGWDWPAPKPGTATTHDSEEAASDEQRARAGSGGNDDRGGIAGRHLRSGQGGSHSRCDQAQGRDRHRDLGRLSALRVRGGGSPGRVRHRPRRDAYYGLPSLGVLLEAYTVGIAVLAVNHGAFITEIVRGGIESIERGQHLASRALGMSGGQTMAYIILPQAIRRILPPLTNESINLLKNSALASTIAVGELLRAGLEVMTWKANTFSPFLGVALMYLVLTLPLVWLSSHLERRYAVLT